MTRVFAGIEAFTTVSPHIEGDYSGVHSVGTRWRF